MTTSYDHARCGYCGVVHLGADGKPVICPLLRPNAQGPNVWAGWSPPPEPKFCPHCGRKVG